jgi:hypothetical protein
MIMARATGLRIPRSIFTRTGITDTTRMRRLRKAFAIPYAA